MNETLKMFKELTEVPGAVGFESKVKDTLHKWIEPYSDSTNTDGLGSLIAVKNGTSEGPKIMIAAHLDEVGFMVTQITKEGFLKFMPLGGWWGQVLLAQRVRIVTRTKEIIGVIGSKPPHVLSAADRQKPVEIMDMFIDIGASSKAEAEEFGVKPGDFIVPECPFTVMENPKLMMAKSWDNRIGCAILVEVFKRLQNEKHANTVYGVATVQEEVGLRGAQTSANMIKPDIAFSIDVGVARDTPGLNADIPAKIGAGPQIVLLDKTMVPHVGLRNYVIDLAEKYQIPFQYESMAGGGTDAGAIHLTGSGVASLAITIATRYIHSHASIIHYDDFENSVKLFVELIKNVDCATIAKL
ncbi:M42 family metallopeptidase [Pseudoneobacillus sp. C159]